MSTFRLAIGIFGAVAIASAAIAIPALAQEVIYEPGYCAQYYPNANCQNMGPGNPNDINYRRGAGRNGAMMPAGATVGIAVKRPRKHRAASSAMRSR